MSIRLDQADLDALEGNLLAEISILDGAIGMAKTQIAQQEEYIARAEQKRRLARRFLADIRAVKAKDPDHTPLPTQASTPPTTKPRTVRPPPLPPRVRTKR